MENRVFLGRDDFFFGYILLIFKEMWLQNAFSSGIPP